MSSTAVARPVVMARLMMLWPMLSSTQMRHAAEQGEVSHLPCPYSPKSPSAWAFGSRR